MPRRRLPFALALGLLPAAPAHAHAYLHASTPAAGAILAAAPKTLTLIYTEDLDLAFCGVTVTDATGGNDAGKPQPVPGHPNEMRVTLDIRSPGKLLVTWHALSTDTHKTQGRFSFTVSKL